MTTTPSYVAFKPNQEVVVGIQAYNKAARFSKSTVYDAKRLIGKKFSDKVVIEDRKHWPFVVVNDGLNRPQVQVKQDNILTRFYPEEISAKVLEKAKLFAENFTGKKVINAVVTVPAYFDNSQK